MLDFIFFEKDYDLRDFRIVIGGGGGGWGRWDFPTVSCTKFCKNFFVVYQPFFTSQEAV